MDMQTDVGIGDADVWTLSCLFAELVDNGILDLIGNKLRVTELLGEYHRINGKGLVVSNVFAPVDVLDTFIDIIGRKCLKVFDRFQNADGCMQLEVGTI